MKLHQSLLCASALLAALVSPAEAREIKEIRFGTDPGNAPFEFKTREGKLAGFDIDLGEAVCARLKAKCTWIENDFDGMIPALKAKKFDVINASMSITEKRMKEIDFSNRVSLSPARMIARASANLQPTAESLKGKRIGVQQGTTHETFAKEKLGRQGVDVVSYAKNDQIYADLQSGRLDAGLMDAVEASEGFLKKPAGKGFAFAGPVLKDEKIFGTGTGFGVRKGDTELKDALNKALAEVKADGTYKKIMTKYFETDVSGD
jgi:lysine/arginine/ornithine transport system substrate-binding protein